MARMYGMNKSTATGSGSGDVVGPGGATDNAVAKFNGTSGKIIQDSGVIIDASNNLSIPSGAKFYLDGALGTTYFIINGGKLELWVASSKVAEWG